MNKKVILISCLILISTACSFGYSCETTTVVPLYIENVSLLSVNGNKISPWSRGAFLSEGKNKLEVKPQNTQVSSNSYNITINVEKYKEYKLKADNILSKICLWEQNPTTKLIISKEPINCISY